MDTVLNWSPERVGRLETLYREGMSFGLIAADIGVTRSAAIGKARRLQLPKRVEPTQSKPHIYSPSRKASAKVIRMEAPKRPAFVPDPGRDYSCTIYDLVNVSCRYPLWDTSTPHPQRRYCGVPDASLVTNRPYCAGHAKLCGGAYTNE